VFPHTRQVHRLPGFWISRLQDPDALVMDQEQIQAHNRKVLGLSHEGLPAGRWDLLNLRLSPQRAISRLRLRLDKLQQAAEQGKRVLADGRRPTALVARLRDEVQYLQPAREIRLAHRSEPMRCYPSQEGIYEKAWDLPFDLAQCAQLRTGEPVRVVLRGRSHYYVWSSYAEGWVRPDALTPALETDQARTFLEPQHAVVVLRDRAPVWSDHDGGKVISVLRLGLRLPLAAEQSARAGSRLQILLPTPSGVGRGWVDQGPDTSTSFPPLTRANLINQGFRMLNSTYGWGGVGGNRDCSRFMMDLFATFGILLPRNSWRQSQAGTRHVEVAGLSDAAKVEAIEAAAATGIVLMYFKGHVMLYLGRDGDHAYALHQFSGYLVPCPGGGETMMRVNRAVVTSLELGRGSSRTAFIERISRLVVFTVTVSDTPT
jgi:cell wall-associated NlpC family hydrolase